MKKFEFKLTMRNVAGILGVLLLLGSIFSVIAWWWFIPGILLFLIFLVAVIQ